MTMSSKKHSKKRNTGLLYEFLVRTISKALVEKDMQTAATALKIVKTHFKPGTELYREFRLFNALVLTTVTSDAVAANILTEAKAAARNYDLNKLDREKSLLIRNINHGLKDENFFDQPISEYKTYATIATLLTDWRDLSGDSIGRIAQYEDTLIKWLTTEKKATPDLLASTESPGTNRLVFKMMTKKLNEKYHGMLSDIQKGVIREYAFFSTSGNSEPVKKKLLEIKDKTLAAITDYSKKNESDFLSRKLDEVYQQILVESFEEINDETITRFMLYTKLDTELVSEEL
jgi:hypothetical protein